MKNTAEKKYIDFFVASEALLNKDSSEEVNRHRMEAFESFKAIGFPNKSIESYKYTDISEAFAQDLDMSIQSQNIDINAENIFKCDVLHLDAYLALFAKGQYVSKERIINNDEGIIVCSFKEAAKKYPELFSKYYNKLAKNDSDGTVAINTALAYDGVFVYVPKSKQLDKPIQVVNLQVDGVNNNSIQLRNLVIVEENAEAKVIFCDDSLTSNMHLSNSVTEVFVAENARVEITKMQNEHSESINVSSIFFDQKDHSVATCHTTSLLGGVIRNNVNMIMDGEHCQANAFGIALIDKQQQVDTHTYIHHAKPNCSSNQLFKNIIDDAGKGIFAGTVLVDKNAQATNAQQSNNNIILTKTAKMNTKPQLIIYADDVKCSHGATVGQLDDNAMFYMRARGIEEKDAKMLLMYAFADDVVKKMSIKSLKENTEDLIQKRLSGELSLCRNCSSRIMKNSAI